MKKIRRCKKERRGDTIFLKRRIKGSYQKDENKQDYKKLNNTENEKYKKFSGAIVLLHLPVFPIS